MLKSMMFALVLAATIGCGARDDQTTLHEARTQNTPTMQAAKEDPSVDMSDPYNRTLPEQTEEEIEEAVENDTDDVAPPPNPPGSRRTPVEPGSADVGNPTDASGSLGTDTNDVDDDIDPMPPDQP